MTRPARDSHDRLENLLEFETLISDTSRALFSAPPDNLDPVIKSSLNKIRDFFGVDRCVLLSVSSDRDFVNVRLESYGEGVPSVSPALNLAECFPWSHHRLLVERKPIRISRMTDLPPEAEVEVESWNQMQIRSALTLPIERAGNISHIILLNSVHRQCEWPDAFVTRLRVLGELLVGALESQAIFIGNRESEKRLDLAAGLAGAGLWSVNIRTREVWGTERLRGLFGYPADRTLSMEDIEAVIHPDDLELVRQAVAEVNSESDFLDTEYRIIQPDDGVERWLRTRGRPQFNSQRELEVIMGVSIDITEPKTNEKALLESESRLARGVELAGLSFYEVDFLENTIFVDSAFYPLCGSPPERAQGREPLDFWLEHLHPEDKPRVLRRRQELHTGKLDKMTLEYRFQNPVSGQMWIQHLAGVSRRDDKGMAIKTFGVLRDISNRKQAESDLHEMSRRLINAHEDERALLARELHDDLTQRMAVLAIDIGRAESVVEGTMPSDTLRGVREELIRLSEDIHSLAYHLHPSVLTELGLVEALRTEVDRRSRLGQLKITLDFDPPTVNLGKEEALCLFRVAQESLNNVVRHADTAVAKVTLGQLEGGVVLTVQDRGVGFDQKQFKVGQHLGLVGMRERVRLVNGTLDIDSLPGKGTTVSAWVPSEGESP